MDYKETTLWQRSLAPQLGDPAEGGPRERLRNVFAKFRERAGVVADEIKRDLPEFTVHGPTHLDALWEMGDLVTGENFVLTPTEAFVLGGAFLIHDLGMGLAAFPDGRAALKADPNWADIVTAAERTNDKTTPAGREIECEEARVLHGTGGFRPA